jgi:thymidylate synthase
MKQYLKLLKDVLKNGNVRKDRTGVGTKAVFGRQLRFKMEDGFPAITTKKLFLKGVKGELLWMLEGSRDIKDLHKYGVHYWDSNANAEYWKPKAAFEGDLGRIYGVQWRKWQRPDGKTVDQLKEVIEKLKNNPADRRMIVSAWNPGEIDQMCLPPCHILYQFFVADNKLSVMMYQRSADLFLGVPFDIALYAMLLHMVAQVTGLMADELIINFGDTHIYLNHFDQVKEQLGRKPYPLPKLWLNSRVKDIDGFTMDDIKLVGYKSHPAIKAEMAV